jgi:outer membrane protein, heavy metal efflux system
MKHGIAAWAMVLAMGCAWAQEAGPVPGADLAALLALARTNNREVAGMRLEAAAAQERVEQADALADPRLKFELQDVTRMGAQSPTLWPADVGSTRYTITQELPWFGTRALKRAQAGYAAQGAQSQAQTVWADVALRIKLAYLQLYVLQRNEALSREILGLVQGLEQMARSRYAGGLAPQQDALRAQTEQTALQGELIALQTEAHHTRARLNALLGRPIHAALAQAQSLRPLPAADQFDVEQLLQRALAHNPQLASDDARLQAADTAQALAQQGRYPSFTLGVAPTQFQNDVKTWDLMLEMNIPLQQGTRRAQEREALALREAAQARRDASLLQLQADLSENLDALLGAQRTEALLHSSLLPQSELSLQSALAGYEAGKLDFASVLEAQRQIRMARLSRIKAQAEGQARLAQLERLLGEE